VKILHVAPAYYPATYWGGPTFSTYALCNSLAALPEVELRVLTCDTAGPRLSQRLPVKEIPVRFSDGYDVYFTRRLLGRDIAPGLIARLWGMIGWADIVLLTATYSFPTIPALITCRLRGKPVIWSPRGALQASYEWSDAKNPLLKREFERICCLVKPHRCVLHVTSEAEKEASLSRLPCYGAAIIPNGVEAPANLPPRVWKPGGVLRLMFISRLDPKKGLENLLAAMPRLDPKTTLDVYGAGDPSYVQSLKRLTAGLGLSARVYFHGHVDGEKKFTAFIGADLFVLPTHSENFGMVVAEALAHGVPAIVSHGAPWRELESRGCGRWVSNKPETLAGAIGSLRKEDLAAMGKRGREWMLADFIWANRARKMKALFDSMILKRRTETDDL
jgi:glycosyltransferase involved in cell wall biosynthesis